MKEILLSQGKVSKVDDGDYPVLMQYKWHAIYSPQIRNWYAASSFGRKFVSMHRFILSAPSNLDVDHIDHNTLNNTRGNLRLATNSNNQANALVRTDNLSGYKGVGWYKNYQAWVVRIRVNGQRIFLGYFDNPELAAEAYDAAAIRYFGQFALTNRTMGLLERSVDLHEDWTIGFAYEPQVLVGLPSARTYSPDSENEDADLVVQVSVAAEQSV